MDRRTAPKERRPLVSLRDLGAVLREDWAAHGQPVASAGFHTVACHRFGRWAEVQPVPLRALLLALYAVASRLLRNIYGIEVPLDAELGRRVVFAHQGGTVVAHGVVIGDDCLIRQNVTIGGIRRGGRSGVPALGRRVHVGAGAAIIGGVTIEDDARIGPNAVVMKNVPAGASAFAPPARIVPPLQRDAHREGSTSPTDTASGSR